MTDRLDRRRFVQLGGATLGAAALAACAAPAATPAGSPAAGATGTTAPSASTPAVAKTARPIEKVRVGGIPGTIENMNWAIGKDAGIWTDLGIDLDVQPLRDTNTALQALVSESIDLADSGLPLQFIALGGPVKVVGASRPKLAIAFYSQASYTSLEQLYGRPVGGAAPGTFLNNLVGSLYRAKGLDPSRLEFVNIGSATDIFRSVITGRLEAGPGGVEFLPEQQRTPSIKLLSEMWKELPDYLRVMFTTTDANLANAQKRDLLTRTLAGYIRAHAFASDPANKEKFVAKAMAEQQRSREDAEFYWQWQKDNEILSQDLSFTEQAMTYMQEENVVAKQQERVLPFAQTSSLQLVQEAQRIARG